MKRSYLMFLLCIAFAVPLLASPPLGAVVDSWHYDPQTRMVTIRIANISEKDITAYNMSITETFADQSVSSTEHLTDMLGAVVTVRQAKGTPDEDRILRELGNGTLEAHQTRERVFGPYAKVVTDFQGTIDVVAYADGRAEATNAPALDRLREHRNAELRSYQKANQILKEVLADSTIQTPGSEAAKRLEKFLADWKAQHAHSMDMETATIEAMVGDLKRAPLAAEGHHLSETEYLHQYAAQKDEHVSFLSVHSQLTTGGAQ